MVFLSVSLLTPLSAAAQQTDYSQQSTTTPLPRTNPDVPHNQHTFVQSLLIELMAAGVCILSGIDVLTPEKGCLGIDPQTRRIGYMPSPLSQEEPAIGGLLGEMAGMIGMLYTPPASSVEYVRYLADNFGIQKAYAQDKGTGFSSLSSMLGLYTITRNLLMVVIFILIGLGIMLRLKIDPRTVMSIQNQIPRIVVALLLVTFSYAIVGLLVDLMWVSTYAGINILGNAQICNNAAGADKQAFIQKATTSLLDNAYAYARNLFESDGCYEFGKVGADGK